MDKGTDEWTDGWTSQFPLSLSNYVGRGQLLDIVVINNINTAKANIKSNKKRIILCKVTFPKIIAQKSSQGPGVGVTKAPLREILI